MNHTSHNVTIGDVAKAAGTSVSTVSRVLSGSTYPVSAAKTYSTVSMRVCIEILLNI